jgi:hypothetical protein
MMKRVLIEAGFKPLVFFLCLLCSVQIAGATTVTIPADDDMIVGARAIVRGRVLSVGSALDERQDRIYTYITLRVQEVIKGRITTRRIVIKELGGIVGDRAMVVYGNPQFTVGERVLLYLDTWADGSLRTYQMFLGKFNIITDTNTGQQMALRSSPDANTVVLPRHLHSTQANESSTERMELGAYTRMVRKRLAANIERSVSFDIEYYRNIPVLARPPEYSAESSRGVIQPHYSFLSPLARWHEPDSSQPVTYTLNPNPADPDSGIPPLVVDPADVAAAANVWSTVSGSALQMVFAGNLNQCYTVTGTQGINVVSDNCDGRNAPSPGCASILAWGGWSGGFFSPKTVSGIAFQYRITQGFVSCNPWAACGFSDHCSVQYIITHEIGHALGIGHSQFTQATMFGTAVSIARCAGLHSDDMDAVRAAYPGSSGGGGPLSITTTSLPAVTTGSAYSQTLVASGGTTPYTWSIVSGFGTLPPGLSLSTGGNISGTPSTAGTYNFRVQVTDAASATATRDLSIAVTAAGTDYNSQFVSQSVPTTLNPGQTFTSTVTWLNTGTQSWDGNTGLRLISQNPPNNVTWGGNTVLLFPFFVSPGQQMSVTFQAFAPTTPGAYNFQWRVAKDANTPFGEMSTNVVIQVGSGGTNNSTFITQSVPTSLSPGQTVSASVTMRNSGTTTWSAGTYKLGSQNPQDNTTWGLSRVNLASSVSPGSDATFTFNITAPSSSGTYNFQWRMLQDGAGFFGASSTNVAVTVGGTSTTSYDAAFVSQSVPPYMVPGQGYVVSVTMRNTGTDSWTSGSSFALGSQNPQDNTTWGMNRVFLNKAIAPGASHTFTFLVTAPTTQGIYSFQWKMFKDTVGFFGAASTNVAVTAGFSDLDPSHPYYTYINRIAELGITLGCGQGTYCPEGFVTREQLAVFIERALGVFSPPVPSSQRFLDVEPSRFGYAFIDDFANRGITLGCGENLYCPAGLVTRQEIATFLERAAGRPNPPTPSFQRFVDVEPWRWGYPFVEAFVQNGESFGIMDIIKRDCNQDGLHFCPGRPITRAEMAAFLVLTFNL